MSTWSWNAGFLFVFISVAQSLGNYETTKEDLCMTTTCDHPVSPESRVLQHCTKHGHTMYGRCCLKTLSHHNATVQEQQHDFYILGIDLSFCGTSPKAHESNDTIIYAKNRLRYLMLEGNKKCGCDNKTFEEMGHLKYLSVPPGCYCPGGNETAWHEINRTTNATICEDAIDLCIEGEPQNYTCPNDQSLCSMYAPGNPWCICKKGYHGYKCLRSGDFPIIIFIVAGAGGTALVAAFLWVTQRRHVKYD